MRVILLVGLLLVPLTTWAAEAKPETPTLTVSGTGTLSLAPDTAFVTLGMETAGKGLAETQEKNAAAMQKVMEHVLQSGIEKERIQTSSFTVTPRYKPQPSPRSGDVVPQEPEIIGYQVSNMLTVEVRALEKVGKVIDAALTAGANRFHGLQWALRDERLPRLRALKMAAAQAREKAQVLGEALDVKLVRILTANESGVHVISSRAFMAREMTGGSQASVPIASGELKVEANVTLVYEIQ